MNTTNEGKLPGTRIPFLLSLKFSSYCKPWRATTRWRHLSSNAASHLTRVALAAKSRVVRWDIEIDPRFVEPGEPRFELVGRVTRVVDGDSLEVQVDGE